jgi:tRNA (adenine57-N1/adenine58-N1)-methyltransferase catalytic subunit
MANVSPFLQPGPRTRPNTLAIVHLSRDNLVPAILNGDAGHADGYVEGTVINTRFGSFPHSTLVDQPWGSQIRASIVDTGSRGRKRKLQDDADEAGNDTEETASSAKKPTTAASGFVHILPPTPELWTMGLPHRTQVVYTPDYSYILHRIRARPGMRIIEAGAGSGSFTHASVRAVFNGHPSSADDKKGKVFSFEFNEARFHQMEKEIVAHGLGDTVTITHRNVYNNGFLVDGQSPEAECVFLDLPAPWKALPHLARSKPVQNSSSNGQDKPWVSPLRSDRPVHLCSFSPCIEQVTRTVEAMRKLGWMEIEMVEVAHRRIGVMREKIGLNMPNDRGTNLSPADVTEAVNRLREVEGRFKEFHGRTTKSAKVQPDDDVDMDEDTEDATSGTNGTNQKSLREDSTAASSIPPFMAGRLIHRTEAEIKTHTSYLVFAVMPQEWTEADEAAAFEKWPCGHEKKVIGSLDKETRKQEKRELLKPKKKRKN